jgi:hypothetical protein
VSGGAVFAHNIEKAVPFVNHAGPGVRNHHVEDTLMRLPRALALSAAGIGLILLPAAHAQNSSTTLGGYGELHYNEPDGSQKGQLDFHRFVIYLGHEFDERISFRAEIELEHTLIEAGEPEGGELAIEQAFIEYRIAPSFGVRGGILLVPVGILNLVHEPPTFHGVERPNVERVIIPTTWREAGAGVFGRINDELAYQAYVLAGLKAEGFSASTGLRGGRQLAFESDPSDPSVSGRVEYTPAPGISLGGSFFYGNSTGGVDSLGSGTVALWSADVRGSLWGLELRGLGAVGTISDAEAINAAYGNEVADRIYGFYIEAAHDILPHLAEFTDQQLFAFVRYERYDTQSAVTGFQPLEQYDRTDIVTGLTYLPVPNVAFKADYSWYRNAKNTAASPNTGQLNLGIGYYFF